MHSVKHSRKLATASLLWQKCLEFRSKRTFHNIKVPTCMHCCLTVLALISALILLYGSHCFSVWLPAKVMHGFTHRVRLPVSHNNVPPTHKMFLDSIIAASWRLPVCCNGELTGRVLELLVMVYTDDQKRAWPIWCVN